MTATERAGRGPRALLAALATVGVSYNLWPPKPPRLAVALAVVALAAAAYRLDAPAGGVPVRRAVAAAVRPLGMVVPLRSTLWLVLAPPVAAAAALAAAVLASALIGPSETTAAATTRASAAADGGVVGAIPLSFLGAALPEEVLFRGALLLLPAALLAWSRSTTHRVALGGLVVFAVLHVPFGAPNVASALLAGLAYTALAVRSGSIWPAVLAHGYYDLAAFLMR